MNEPRSNDQGQEGSERRATQPPAGERISSSRRRLIRAGASSVPIIATLASRPVLAGPCNSTSAWGSALMATQSVTARAVANATDVTPWTEAQWKDNSPNGAPWNALHAAVGGFADAAGMRNQYTVSQLFIDGSPDWTIGPKKVKHVLNGTQGTDFQRMIVTAKLNWRVGATGVSACLAAPDLASMGDGMYAPQNGGSIWNASQIQDYLRNNHIVGL